jgi:hypothetical protein
MALETYFCRNQITCLSNEYTGNNRGIVGGGVFSAVHVMNPVELGTKNDFAYEDQQ